MTIDQLTKNLAKTARSARKAHKKIRAPKQHNWICFGTQCQNCGISLYDKSKSDVCKGGDNEWLNEIHGHARKD